MITDIIKKLIILLLPFLIPLDVIGQVTNKISVNLNCNWSNIIYDRLYEGAGGFTLDLDLLINTKTKFDPKIEVNYSIFSVLEDYLETLDGYPVVSMNNGPSVFMGLSYNPFNRFNVSFSPGICFFNSRTYFAVKPGIGLYLDNKKRFLAKASLTNIFINDHAGNQPEGFVNLGLGVRLY